MDQEEYENFMAEEANKKILEHSETIDNFIEHCSKHSLSLNRSNFEYIPTIGIVAQSENILLVISPHLEIDKEGLLSFENINKLYNRKMNEGYLYADNYMAMLSPRFRRGFNPEANWEPCFVEELWGQDLEGIDASVRVDLNRVRVDVSNLCYLEKDAWYGPHYNQSISSIQDGLYKSSPPLDLEKRHISFMFANNYSFNVLWRTAGNIKSFQALEFKTDDITIDHNGEEYYPVRYVHAEYDLDKKHFRHFDGALQYLTKDEYCLRRDTDFNHDRKTGKHVKPFSEKLFKFNGVVSEGMWREFTSQFFAKNPVVYEYFCGEYPQNTQSSIDKIREYREKAE